MRGFSRLVSSVGYLACPAVVSEGLADPPANPCVRVVVAGLQGLDHSRDPGRGRAVGDGVDHVAADPWIGIPGQLEQPRPHPVVVGPDVAGAQVPARELASPALLAPGQLQQSVDSILGCAPLAGRQAGPCLFSDLAPPSHRPDDSAGRLPGPRIISSAGGAFGPLTSPVLSAAPSRASRSKWRRLARPSSARPVAPSGLPRGVPARSMGMLIGRHRRYTGYGARGGPALRRGPVSG
jgi:hypothetical protein